MMFHVWTTPSADETGHASDIAIGISRGLYAAACGVVYIRLVDVDQIPVRGTYITALVLQGRLSEDYADRVLSELFVVGQRVLNLPGGAVRLLCILMTTRLR